MKKYFWVLVIGICLLCACTKRGNEYVIEGDISVGGQNLPFKSYVSDKKWHTEYTNTKGVYTFLYNGKKFYTYGPNAKAAMNFNFNENDILQRNPINPILNWRNGGSVTTRIPDGISAGSKVSSKRSSMNGFDCMMIDLSKSRTVCVSEKYGFAVYLRYVFANGSQTVLNVKSVEPLCDKNAFKLPRGFKIYTMKAEAVSP